MLINSNCNVVQTFAGFEAATYRLPEDETGKTFSETFLKKSRNLHIISLRF